MTEKHYPYCGGSFDRIIFDKDGSVWVPETENAKLRELVADMYTVMVTDAANCDVTYPEQFDDRLRELEVDA